MKPNLSTLDRMAKAAYDCNQELDWQFLHGIGSRVDLAKIEHSWERQDPQLRHNWREMIQAALDELELEDA